MNCLDCAQLGSSPEPAVAVCTGCGAAICLSHVVVRERVLTQTAVINREVPVDPPARVVRCTTCDAAVSAQVGQPSGRKGSGSRSRR
jgi:hypothetical protein